MVKRFGVLAVLGGVMALTACAYKPPLGQAYWQRVEDNSALYMTGPKAQQQLHEDIAGCVREVDELVQLEALRHKIPADTQTDYYAALNASGDLDHYDTPTRYGAKKIAHKDFQDFETCMEHRGWERVRFVRYDVARESQKVYKDTQNIRKWGGVPGGDVSSVEKEQRKVATRQSDFENLNR